MGERLDWVQIIEPKSKDVMYANLLTGECVWEAPAGAGIKRTDENQWWELVDISTKRNYYYNVASQRTVWQRPTNGDIIPLARFQMIKENTEPKDEQTMITSPISLINQMNQQLTTANNMPWIRRKKWKQVSLQALDMTAQENESNISTPSLNSTASQTMRRTVTVLHSNTMLPTSSTDSRKSKSRKNEKSIYANLGNAKSKSPVIRHPSESTPASSCHEQRSCPAGKELHGTRPQMSQSKASVLDNSTTNDSRHRRATPSSNTLSSKQHNSSTMLRHISSPTLDHSPSHHIKSMSLSRSSFGRNNIRKKQPRTNPNYVNIQVKTDDGSLRSTYIRLDDVSKCQTLSSPSSSSSSPSSSSSSSTSSSASSPNSSSEQDSILDCSQSYSNGYFPTDETISIDRTNREPRNAMIIDQQPLASQHENRIDDAHTLTNRTATVMKQRLASTPSNNYLDNNRDINRGIYANTSTLSSPVLSNYHDNQSKALSFSNPIASSAMHPCPQGHSNESLSSLTRSVSIQSDTLFYGQRHVHLPAHKHFTSSLSKISPTAALMNNESDIVFHDMLNLNVQKRSLFGKPLHHEHLLSWSKEGLSKSLLRTNDKILKREAPELFKLIQIYMGDKKSKQVASLNVCLELTIKGWSLPSIRDELYLQLIKQTHENNNEESLQRGWELMSICLSFFPPSSKFQAVLERYIALQVNGDADTPEVTVSIYAQVCQKRLEKILQTGPKRGLKKPTCDEIELSKHTIHFPSMFGASLVDVMAMQRTRHPDRRLPWIQTILSEEVLRLDGTRIEGIFRVPGDLDNVNALKVKCDQWQLPALDDPHLPASLLKLWYRELSEPLIPTIFYEQCILDCDKAEACIRIVHSLPDINRAVLTYLIRFLQIFIAPDNVLVTKMDVNNLSMVFAPNILRCNSDDARVIFENARKEMLFVKNLIVHLDTDSMQGVL